MGTHREVLLRLLNPVHLVRWLLGLHARFTAEIRTENSRAGSGHGVTPCRCACAEWRAVRRPHRVPCSSPPRRPPWRPHAGPSHARRLRRGPDHKTHAERIRPARATRRPRPRQPRRGRVTQPAMLPPCAAPGTRPAPPCSSTAEATLPAAAKLHKLARLPAAGRAGGPRECPAQICRDLAGQQAGAARQDPGSACAAPTPFSPLRGRWMND